MGVSVTDKSAKKKNMASLLALSLLLNAIAFAHGCGEALEGRIVGGGATEAHAIPWQVGLVGGGSRPFCGGTIICPKWIMTAAHCNLGSFQVLAQEHQVAGSGNSADGTRHEVARVIPHPDYDDNTVNNDFMLVELVEPIDLTGTSKARAACLPTESDIESYTAAGSNFVVSGWGALEQGGSSPNVLHSAIVPHISDSVCNEADKYDNRITSQMMCAGHLAGGIDSCQGDSGGPLTWADPSTSKVKLVGVVSWGFGCAQPNLPGVYAEITSVLSWINGIIPNTCSNGDSGTGTTSGPNPGPTTTIGPNPEPSTTNAPNPEPTTTSDGGSTGDCEIPSWHGDSWCDDVNNNAACNYDGGDCCASTNGNPDKDVYCDDCSCLDPAAPEPPTTEVPCEDIWPQRRCDRILSRGKCDRPRPQTFCALTCGAC